MTNLLIQEILTFFIVGIAGIYTLYQFAKIFIPSKDKKSGCAGCSGNCATMDTKQTS